MSSSRTRSFLKVFVFLLGMGMVPLMFFLWGGASPVHKEEGKLLVVATTGIIADAVEAIGQDRVTVKALMGPGVDPHTYEPTVQDGDALMEADVILYNGLHLEGPMYPVFEKMKGREDVRIYAVSDGLDPEDILLDPHFSEGQDPHIWHSVVLWKKAVRYIGVQLQRADPDQAACYQANTEAYVKALDALHQDIVAEIEKIPPHLRILVTAHDAFAYFGKTYGVKVKSLQGISTVSEPSVRDREDLTQFILAHQIETIFAETSVPSKGIQAVIESCAKQGYTITTDAYLYSDALAERDSPAGTYIGMMRTNVRHMVTASQPSV